MLHETERRISALRVLSPHKVCLLILNSCCLCKQSCLFLDTVYTQNWRALILHWCSLTLLLLLLSFFFFPNNDWPQRPVPLTQASLFRPKWPVPPLQVPEQADQPLSSGWCSLNGTRVLLTVTSCSFFGVLLCWCEFIVCLLWISGSLDALWKVCKIFGQCCHFFCFLSLCASWMFWIWIVVKFFSVSTPCASPHPPLFSITSVPFFSLILVSTPAGMNGKSVLSAMGRHTPEHSGVMSTAGSGATTSPCSSRSSSQRSGTGAHTPGGPHRSPCTNVKTSEGCSKALTPNAGPARSPMSPKLSPGEVRHTQTRADACG